MTLLPLYTVMSLSATTIVGRRKGPWSSYLPRAYRPTSDVVHRSIYVIRTGTIDQPDDDHFREKIEPIWTIVYGWILFCLEKIDY